MAQIINFEQLGGPVYAGRPKGEKAREQFELDKEDGAGGVVRVVIPDDAFSLNSSFFLGLFGPSVRALGGREGFTKKYAFEAPEFIMESVYSGIDRAMQEAAPL